jgi:asparagine synthase (glutamine-hydrolysing)
VVSQQMLADVPLGSFLSGGVDSSLITAMLQKQSSIPIKTFSIGFYEQGYNEAEYAKSVAQHLKTEHTELYITPEQALAVIPKLPTIYDEPFADSSQIPTFLVAQLAKQRVTVALSGDGGDELFAGYNRYQFVAQHWAKIEKLPHWARAIVASTLSSASSRRAVQALMNLTGLNKRWSNLDDKLQKLSGVLGCTSVTELYKRIITQWPDAVSIVIGGRQLQDPMLDQAFSLQLNNVEKMMLADQLGYLPNDILTKVDRAAMAVSLETRAPFLDHRLIEFAWQLPLNFKLRESTTKWALRQVLYRYVPKELIERPKMGFALPIGRWLRTSMREWAEDLLDESRLQNEGYLQVEPIRQKWAEHLAGKHNWQHQLWSVLMFQAWLRENQS